MVVLRSAKMRDAAKSQFEEHAREVATRPSLFKRSVRFGSTLFEVEGYGHSGGHVVARVFNTPIDIDGVGPSRLCTTLIHSSDGRTSFQSYLEPAGTGVAGPVIEHRAVEGHTYQTVWMSFKTPAALEKHVTKLLMDSLGDFMGAALEREDVSGVAEDNKIQYLHLKNAQEILSYLLQDSELTTLLRNAVNDNITREAARRRNEVAANLDRQQPQYS